MTLDDIHQWDNHSLRLLYKDFYKALVAFAIQITADRHISEDIVQEVFFNTWKKKNTFQTVGALKAYLFNSVRNEGINHLRQKQVRSDHLQSIRSEYKEMFLSSDKEEKLYKEEVYRQLFLAIDQLPPKQREIFLQLMKGKKNVEIAQSMGVSINTVKAQKQHGIKALRDKLSPESFVLLLLMLR
ncbi:MAG: RNA polymerase sigma-70 factor [Prevotella sp.]|nr:RNA polymerase sigma-70 factor [Prevotella sp.]